MANWLKNHSGAYSFVRVIAALAFLSIAGISWLGAWIAPQMVPFLVLACLASLIVVTKTWGAKWDLWW